jgi:hypothetical protein
MLNNRVEIFRGILIGSSIFLCSILLIIAFYLLYRYRQKTIYFHENLNDKQINIDFDEQFKKDNSNFHQIKETEEEINYPLNNEKKVNNIERTSPTIIEELMRKSLQLAKTAEKVADHNEKRFTLKDNIHLDL